MDNIFILDFVSSGSSETIVREPMYGSPRLFAYGDLYVYNASSGLLKLVSDAYSDITPVGMPNVSAITTVPDTTSYDTVALGSIGNESGVWIYGLLYTPYPEPVAGVWSSGSPLPSGFVPVDSVSDQAGSINILTANRHGGTEPRIMVSTGSKPYSLSKSDTGIPVDAIMTDLELTT